jgi:hypothetical protein
MSNVLELAIRQPFILRVNGENHQVTYPVSVVAELEEKLGRPFRSVTDWLRISAGELELILCFGLETYHPEEASQISLDVCAALEPEAIETVIEALCVSNFPKAMERYRIALEKAQEEARRGLSPKA